MNITSPTQQPPSSDQLELLNGSFRKEASLFCSKKALTDQDIMTAKKITQFMKENPPVTYAPAGLSYSSCAYNFNDPSYLKAKKAFEQRLSIGIVNPRMRLSDIQTIFSIQFVKSPSYETLEGLLITSNNGKIPKVGTSFSFTHVTVCILASNEERGSITEVRIIRNPPPD